MSVIRDKSQEEFNETYMPCVNCTFAGICKHKNSVEIIKVPAMFNVKITCTEQEKLMKPYEKGRNQNEQ